MMKIRPKTTAYSARTTTKVFSIEMKISPENREYSIRMKIR